MTDSLVVFSEEEEEENQKEEGANAGATEETAGTSLQAIADDLAVGRIKREKLKAKALQAWKTEKASVKEKAAKMRREEFTFDTPLDEHGYMYTDYRVGDDKSLPKIHSVTVNKTDLGTVKTQKRTNAGMVCTLEKARSRSPVGMQCKKSEENKFLEGHSGRGDQRVRIEISKGGERKNSPRKASQSPKTPGRVSFVDAGASAKGVNGTGAWVPIGVKLKNVRSPHRTYEIPVDDPARKDYERAYRIHQEDQLQQRKLLQQQGCGAPPHHQSHHREGGRGETDDLAFVHRKIQWLESTKKKQEEEAMRGTRGTSGAKIKNAAAPQKGRKGKNDGDGENDEGVSDITTLHYWQRDPTRKVEDVLGVPREKTKRLEKEINQQIARLENSKIQNLRKEGTKKMLAAYNAGGCDHTGEQRRTEEDEKLHKFEGALPGRAHSDLWSKFRFEILNLNSLNSLLLLKTLKSTQLLKSTQESTLTFPGGDGENMFKKRLRRSDKRRRRRILCARTRSS